MSHLSLVTAILLSCSLSMGCHLYLDDDEDRAPDVREPRPDPEPCFGERCGPGPQQAPPDAGYRTDGGVGDECQVDFQCGPGCYCTPNGYCEESTSRPDAAPLTCSDLGSETDCINRDQCSAVYRGINCAAEDGSACSSNSADCECESFAFDRCEEA
jgi:hypothetical protein